MRDVREIIAMKMIDLFVADDCSFEDEADAILSALADAGYVVVPKEPTRAMLEAGAIGSGEDSEVVADGAWERMIRAAQEKTNG